MLCHGVWEGSSSQAEEEGLDEPPFVPLFRWLEPVAFAFVITARGTAWTSPLDAVLQAVRTGHLRKNKDRHTSQADCMFDLRLVLSIALQSQGRTGLPGRPALATA